MEIDKYGIEKNLYYETKYSPIVVNGNVKGVTIFTTNITKKMLEIERVRESEEKFRLIYSTMSQGLAIHEVIIDDNNNPIDYRYLEVNDSYMKLFGYKRENIVGKRVKEVAPEIEDYWIQLFGKVAISGEPTYHENYSKTIEKYLSVYAYSPKPMQFAVLISDITERVMREKEIEFLSFNDQLTGLFNRRHYEQQLVELDKESYYPLSIIIGDVNGLKLVNDSFGHQMGDQLLIKVANIIKKSCRNTDVITRIGGDEFVVLLPNTSNEQTKQVVNRIRETAKKETIQSIEVSISFGYGTKSESSQLMTNLFKIAEDEMYSNKLSDSRSMRGKTVDLIMTTLFEKNEREMFHSKRVSGYCEALASALQFEPEQINLLKNAGLMHDIGKIGIPDDILNKKEFLTIKEREEVQKHSEVGYRILSSIPEFSELSKYILEHHENYDGSGYPKGLKAEEISLQARMISVVDAYDAMTGPRPYKKHISKNEAIKELQRCSGTQFDPKIVDVFVNKVLDIS
jgi:diguanylate cyclase (GGDEF)-like protein/PAS domain S-box-containing protein/putative nucleotidyltransferase with HDIG domain